MLFLRAAARHTTRDLIRIPHSSPVSIFSIQQRHVAAGTLVAVPEIACRDVDSSGAPPFPLKLVSIDSRLGAFTRPSNHLMVMLSELGPYKSSSLARVIVLAVLNTIQGPFPRFRVFSHSLPLTNLAGNRTRPYSHDVQLSIARRRLRLRYTCSEL